jgi:hypothetical protein
MIQTTIPQATSLAGAIIKTSIIILIGVFAASIAFRIARAISSRHQSNPLARLSVTTGSDISSSSDDTSFSISLEQSTRSPAPQKHSYQVNVYLPVRSTSSTYEWAAVATELSRVDAEELKHDIDTAFVSCYPEEFAVEVTARDASTDSPNTATLAELSVHRAWETKLNVTIEQAESDQPSRLSSNQATTAPLETYREYEKPQPLADESESADD